MEITRYISGVKTKKLINGIEKNDELNTYEAKFRELGPTIGRWWQADPEAESLTSYSPYESMGNNPVNNVDPLGDFSTRFGAWWHRLWNGGGSIGQNQFGEWYVGRSLGNEISDNGDVIAKSAYYYGEGRNARGAVSNDNSIPPVMQMALDNNERWYNEGWRHVRANQEMNSHDGAIRHVAQAIQPVDDPVTTIIGPAMLYGAARKLGTYAAAKGVGKFKFPGNNPAKAPKGFEWKGRPGSTPGSKDGNRYNPKTGESLRPDLNHPNPIGPHWGL